MADSIRTHIIRNDDFIGGGKMKDKIKTLEIEIDYVSCFCGCGYNAEKMIHGIPVKNGLHYGVYLIEDFHHRAREEQMKRIKEKFAEKTYNQARRLGM